MMPGAYWERHQEDRQKTISAWWKSRDKDSFNRECKTFLKESTECVGYRRGKTIL